MAQEIIVGESYFLVYVIISVLIISIVAIIGFILLRRKSEIVPETKNESTVSKTENVTHNYYSNDGGTYHEPPWQDTPQDTPQDTQQCAQASRVGNENGYRLKQFLDPNDDVYGKCEQASPECRQNAKCTDTNRVVSGCSVKGSLGEWGCPTQCCANQLQSSWPNDWGRINPVS